MGRFLLDGHTRGLGAASGDGPAAARRDRSVVAFLRKKGFTRHRTRDRSLAPGHPRFRNSDSRASSLGER